MFAMDQIQSADLAAMALYFGPKRHGVFAAIAWYFHRNVTVFSPQWHGIFAARTQFSRWNGTRCAKTEKKCVVFEKKISTQIGS